jgi:hypothetical protein
LTFDEIDVGRKVCPHAARCADADASWIDQPQTVKGQDCISGQIGVVAGAQYGLHELPVLSISEIVESVDAVGHVGESSTRGHLAQLDGGHTDLSRHLAGYVTVVVARDLAKSTSIGISSL